LRSSYELGVNLSAHFEELGTAAFRTRMHTVEHQVEDGRM
jgi:hypothetical protein